ncbi:MAG: hypothetical protein PVH80_11340 [Anaerolineae bacterium]
MPMGVGRPFALAALLATLVALSASCAATPGPLKTEADFIGFITEIHPKGGGDAPGEILVESHADKIVTRYIVAVTRETLIFRQDGDDLRKTGFKTLENKQWVEIWWAGPTTGNDPVQGTAAQVVIQ